MSSPVHTGLLQPRQFNFSSEGHPFLMHFCFFFFALSFSSIMACIWNSSIWTKHAKPSTQSETWCFILTYFYVYIPFCCILSDLRLWSCQWLCSSCLCDTRWRSLFQPRLSLWSPPECRCCPPLFLDLGPARVRWRNTLSILYLSGQTKGYTCLYLNHRDLIGHQAVSDNKVARGYVQTFLRHGCSDQQINLTTAEFLQHVLLLGLINAQRLVQCTQRNAETNNSVELTAVIGLTTLWSPPPIRYAALTAMSANFGFSCIQCVRAMALRRVFVKMIPLASFLPVNSWRIVVFNLERLSFSYSGFFASSISSSLFSVGYSQKSCSVSSWVKTTCYWWWRRR